MPILQILDPTAISARNDPKGTCFQLMFLDICCHDAGCTTAERAWHDAAGAVLFDVFRDLLLIEWLQPHLVTTEWAFLSAKWALRSVLGDLIRVNTLSASPRTRGWRWRPRRYPTRGAKSILNLAHFGPILAQLTVHVGNLDRNISVG